MRPAPRRRLALLSAKGISRATPGTGPPAPGCAAAGGHRPPQQSSLPAPPGSCPQGKSPADSPHLEWTGPVLTGRLRGPPPQHGVSATAGASVLAPGRGHPRRRGAAEAAAAAAAEPSTVRCCCTPNAAAAQKLLEPGPARAAGRPRVSAFAVRRSTQGDWLSRMTTAAWR